jgi:hypothetical protein
MNLYVLFGLIRLSLLGVEGMTVRNCGRVRSGEVSGWGWGVGVGCGGGGFAGC